MLEREAAQLSFNNSTQRMLVIRQQGNYMTLTEYGHREWHLYRIEMKMYCTLKLILFTAILEQIRTQKYQIDIVYQVPMVIYNISNNNNRNIIPSN